VQGTKQPLAQTGAESKSSLRARQNLPVEYGITPDEGHSFDVRSAIWQYSGGEKFSPQTSPDVTRNQCHRRCKSVEEITRLTRHVQKKNNKVWWLKETYGKEFLLSAFFNCCFLFVSYFWSKLVNQIPSTLNDQNKLKLKGEIAARNGRLLAAARCDGRVLIT